MFHLFYKFTTFQTILYLMILQPIINTFVESAALCTYEIIFLVGEPLFANAIVFLGRGQFSISLPTKSNQTCMILLNTHGPQSLGSLSHSLQSGLA